MGIDWGTLLVTPLVAGLVGYGVWYFKSQIEALQRAKERLHDDRRKVYLDVLEPFVRIFAAIKNPKEDQKGFEIMLSVDYKRTAALYSHWAPAA